MTERSSRDSLAARPYAHPKIIAMARRIEPTDVQDWLQVVRSDMRAILKDMAEHADRHQNEEETLTYWIANSLRCLGYTAYPEADQKGHTDLLIKAEGFGHSWLAECKILRKYDDLDHGLGQLLDDYSSGYEDGLALIVYYFRKNMRKAMMTWASRLESAKVCRYTAHLSGEETILPSGFVTEHEHLATGDPVRVEHIPIALYTRKAAEAPDDSDEDAAPAE